MKITRNDKSNQNKYIKIIWTGVISVILGSVLFFWMASNGWLGDIPDVTDLENPDINVASEVYSSDGKLLERFEEDKRIPLEYKELPSHLVNALLAKEDIRFREHTGIDFIAVLRAITGQGGGGSTITQQLAKQLYTGERSRFLPVRIRQKIFEWITSISLERRYTKEEIIAMYFNKFDFLFNANGIEAASRIYFNKETKNLTLSEAAMFVGMFQNPVQINPIKNMPLAIEKRNGVLNKMAEYGFISVEEARSLSKEKIGLDFNPKRLKTIKEVYSAYFKYALKKDVLKILDDYEKESGIKYNLYRDGLKIYVTIDSRMQKFAEEAIKTHLKSLQKSFFSEHKNNSLAPFYGLDNKKRQRIFLSSMRQTNRYKELVAKGLTDEEIIKQFKKPTRLEIFTWDGLRDTLMSPMDSIIYHKHIVQAGLMSMDPTTGNIKAWVGGIDWDHFKFDHVKQARRQVGSTFKPFVYLTALNQMNYTPCTTISNEPFSVGNWHPKNSSGNYGGMMSLRTGMAFSVNTISARLIHQTTPTPVIQLAKEMGVTSPIVNDLTISLGSPDLTLFEMVGAFNVFANKGIYTKPEMIWRIEDNKGVIIKEFNIQTREVVSEEVAYAMIDLLKGVVDYGTGQRVRGYGISGEVAGKTGTTNENSDGWFIGIVPNLVTGVWVGWEDRFAHFRSTYMGQGSSTALPVWANYMNGVYSLPNIDIKRGDKFEIPISDFKLWQCDNDRYNFDLGVEEGYIYQKNGSKKPATNSSTKDSLDKIDFDQ